MFIFKSSNRKSNISMFVGQIICVALGLLFLSGCSSNFPELNNPDNEGFFANLKADANAAYGKKAAGFGGRIYYLSAESGVQGIHSMNARGEEIMLEIPVEDIRSINIREDGIYYAGFVGIEENAAGPFRQFRLLTRKNGNATAMDFLETVGYHNALLDENVGDFYISDNGVVVIYFMEVNSHMKVRLRYLVSFQNSTVVDIDDYEVVDESNEVVYTTFNESPLGIGHLDGLYFMSDSFGRREYFSGEAISSFESIIDLESNSKIAIKMLGRNIGYNDNQRQRYWRWFCRGDTNEFIFASAHGLEAYDIPSNKVRDIVVFDQPETLFYQIDCGESFLVFTQWLRKSYEANYYFSEVLKLNRVLGESLYRVSPETGEKKLLLTLARNNSFLYADANTAVTGGGRTISIYDIAMDTPVLLKTIELEHKIVDRANKVDTAGGWLFLYGFNEKTQRDELLEKVYIGS